MYNGYNQARQGRAHGRQASHAWRISGERMGWEGMEGSRPPEARPPKREAEPKPGKPKEYVGQH